MCVLNGRNARGYVKRIDHCRLIFKMVCWSYLSVTNVQKPLDNLTRTSSTLYLHSPNVLPPFIISNAGGYAVYIRRMRSNVVTVPLSNRRTTLRCIT